jgi:hypothetical protein
VVHILDWPIGAIPEDMTTGYNMGRHSGFGVLERNKIRVFVRSFASGEAFEVILKDATFSEDLDAIFDEILGRAMHSATSALFAASDMGHVDAKLYHSRFSPRKNAVLDNIIDRCRWDVVL